MSKVLYTTTANRHWLGEWNDRNPEITTRNEFNALNKKYAWNLGSLYDPTALRAIPRANSTLRWTNPRRQQQRFQTASETVCARA